MSKTTNKDKDVKTSPKEGSNKNTLIAIIVGVLIVVAVATGVVYLVVNSRLSDTASEESNSTVDPAIVEAIKNASPGESFSDIDQKTKAEEQKLEDLTEGSKEWTVQQYNIASMYLSVNDFGKALSANETALNSAQNIGDAELIKQLEVQRQSIADKKQLLEQIGQ